MILDVFLTVLKILQETRFQGKWSDCVTPCQEVESGNSPIPCIPLPVLRESLTSLLSRVCGKQTQRAKLCMLAAYVEVYETEQYYDVNLWMA